MFIYKIFYDISVGQAVLLINNLSNLLDDCDME